MTARLRIDRRALAANYQRYCAAAVGEVAAVVKADAYGIGAIEASRVFAAAGCRYFFVARVAEGVQLRRSGSDKAIYVLEGPLPETLDSLLEYDLVPVLNSPEQLALWAAHHQGPAAAHIDTGMNRLGFSVDAAQTALKGVQVDLLLTHLACADEPAHPLNDLQLERIRALKVLFPGIRLSVGNSAGILNGPDFQGDLVRAGIGLYGGNPWTDRPNPMQAVATLETEVVQVREVAVGETVGYGATYQVARRGRAAIVGIGYADGLPRALSNCGKMFAHGRQSPIVGRVSMDLTVIDATEVDLAVGDWVEVFGPNLPVDAVAAQANTIAYEMLTGLSKRVARVYE